MAGLQITITNAGRAALPNGPNTGTSAVTISHVGVSPVHTAGSLKALTSLPGEVKRVTTFGGDILADDVIHVTINDETTAVYSVRSFGLYLSTGVLFAVFSSPDVVVEKSAGAMVLLSADITFKTLDTAVIQFGGTGFINPPATTERVGVVELATWEEAAAGARADVVVTPFGLLKTLQSWATNFAAAIHRHAMSSIDGLPEALAGKSATGHQHAAGDVVSGVFDVGRIPALGMEKITGLATALANKAAAIHEHAMSEVTGLVAALALKASLGANVSFSDVRVTRGGRTGVLYFGDGDEFILLTGGDLATNRPFNSPALSNAGYPVWHTGNFNPATKATLGATVRFASVELGVGKGLIYGENDRVVIRAGAAGAERYFGFNDDGSFQAYNGHIFSQSGRVWDPGNFNPATKATLGETVTFADVRAFRANGTGVVYLGDLSHYVFFDGANYNMPGAPLIVNGGVVWTSATFNPNLKANAATPSFTGTSYFGTEKRGQIWLMGGDDRPGVLEFRVDGVRYGFIGYGDGPNGNMYFGTDDNRTWIFTKRPSFNGATPWDAANLAFASGGEVVAGTEHAKMISPAGLFAFAKSLGNPAYAVIPGTGLMVQCGVMTGNFAEGQAHAALPVAFGGGCIAAVAVPQNPGSNLASNYFMQVVSKNLDRIVFYANRSDSSSGNINGFEWIAIGRVSGNPDPVYSSGGGGGGGGGGQVDPYV